MNKLCACGCLKEVKPGNIYLRGHHGRGKPGLKGDKNPAWKGGKIFHSGGYVNIYSPDHPNNHNGYVSEHILIMEKALGRYINPPENVHHIDGDKTNNSIGNLMLFATTEMHSGYHARLRSFNASGHWDWDKCRYCKKFDDPAKMDKYGRHISCHNEYEKNRYYAKRDGGGK